MADGGTVMKESTDGLQAVVFCAGETTGRPTYNPFFSLLSYTKIS
jgi:hypothetical protein